MLAGLRLDGFVGGDDEQDQVDASDAGQHIPDEALMAGDVDKSQVKRIPVGGTNIHVGEAEIDRDSAALFFLEAVGVDAGESLDQRGLPVIDMPGRPDDDRFHAARIVAGRGCRNIGLKPGKFRGTFTRP